MADRDGELIGRSDLLMAPILLAAVDGRLYKEVEAFQKPIPRWCPMKQQVEEAYVKSDSLLPAHDIPQRGSS